MALLDKKGLKIKRMYTTLVISIKGYIWMVLIFKFLLFLYEN